MQPSDLISLGDALAATGGCAGNEADEVKAAALAGVATSLITNYLGTTLHYEAGIVEVLAGKSTPLLVLSRSPVREITGILVSGYSALHRSTKEELRAGLVRSYYGSWVRRAAVGPGIAQPIPTGFDRADIEIVYDAGYTTPNQAPVSGVPTLPAAIGFACTQLVGYLASQNGGSATAASESLLSYSVSYGAPEATLSETGGIPIRIASLLTAYRRVVIV